MKNFACIFPSGGVNNFFIPIKAFYIFDINGYWKNIYIFWYHDANLKQPALLWAQNESHYILSYSLFVLEWAAVAIIDALINCFLSVHVKEFWMFKWCISVLLWYVVIAQWDHRAIVVADGSLWLRALKPIWHHQTADAMLQSSLPCLLPVCIWPVSLSFCLSLLRFDLSFLILSLLFGFTCASVKKHCLSGQQIISALLSLNHLPVLSLH